MKRFLIFFLSIAILAACSPKNPRISESDVESRREELNKQSESRTVQVVPGPYLGAESLLLSRADRVLNNRITLNMRGTLSQICQEAGKMLTLVTFLVEDTGKSSPVNTPAITPPLANLLEPVLSGEPSVRVSYEGTVRGFLDHVGSLFNVGWMYDESSSTISLSVMQVKTFTLLAAPGKVTYKNQITNQSKENNTSGGGGTFGQSVNASDVSSQTAQSNLSEYKADVWLEAVEGIKALLSKTGSVSANPAAGTVTVKDYAPVLRQITHFVENINIKLSRQVALSVRVWQLELSDSKDIGLDLQAIFESGKLGLTSGGATLNVSNSGGELGATITGGKLKGSQATLKALSSFGKTTFLTSGSGITMNNQPMPVQNTTKIPYLAGVNTYQGDYGQTTEISPGEITVGFSLTVTPHILDRRSLILQYNCSLVSLDEMREYNSEFMKVEMPKVSTRAFSQRVTMKMGETLVLAGFEQEKQGGSNTVGLFAAGHSGEYGRTLVIITISVESMPGYEVNRG